jgi:imidazolonepropionase-like amidohydrolase
MRFVLLLWAGACFAQTLLFQHANVIDGVSDQPLRNASVLVRDGKIVSVSAKPVAAPPGARVIDLEGRWVLPGLIDAHVHISSMEAAKAALVSGVTTVRSMGVSNFVDVAYRELHKSGVNEIPEFVAAGYHVRPQPAPQLFENVPALRDLSERVTGVANIRRVVAAMLERKVDVIKILATERAGTPETDPRKRTFTDQEIEAAVSEAKAKGIPVAAHAHGTEGAAAAVRAGVHSIEHGTWLDEPTLRLMKQKGIYLVPTIATVVDLIEPGGDYDDPALRERGKMMLPFVKQTTATAHKLGVRIVAGTDTSYGSKSVRRMGDEVVELVNAGLSPMQAIRAATSTAAECVGVAARTGAVRPGLEADLIVVDQDPLANAAALKNVVMVINDGKIALNRLTR